MQTTYFWHQLYLYGKKAGLVSSILLLLVSAQVSAQRHINLPDYDKKPLHYGFQIGIFNSVLNVRTAEEFLSPGFTYNDSLSLVSVRGAWQQGFSVGFIMNFALPDELWSLRLMPNVAFYGRQIDLYTANGALEDPLFSEVTVVEVPLMLKYKASRRRNSRMYFTGGLTTGFQVGGKDAADGSGVSLNKTNYELSYGVGFDFYWQLFKFAPEVRFSHGLNSIVNPSATAPFIQGATTHKVSLLLNFE